MKDCTTCKYGYEDERLGIPMCHHPKRFSEDCVDFNMHEEKETEESEKPMNQDGLEEEIHNYNKERFDEYFPEQDGDFISEVDFMTCLDRVARHFAQWQREQDRLEIANIKAKLWQDGFDDCKEQMMKEAVEVRVQTSPLHGPLGISAYCCNFPSEHPFYHCKEGDKVRIIIVKDK